MKTFPYKWMKKCPINSIPAKALFKMLNKKLARDELTRRGWDIKAIIRANKTIQRTA